MIGLRTPKTGWPGVGLLCGDELSSSKSHIVSWFLKIKFCAGYLAPYRMRKQEESSAAHRVLAGFPEGRKPVGRPIHKWSER